MKKDRSHWTVRRVTFAEAEEIDNEYYASLSEVERLELLMDLRSMVETDADTIVPFVMKRHVKDEEEV